METANSSAMGPHRFNSWLSTARVFTLPDITENTMHLVDLEGAHWFNDRIQLSGNVFYRATDTDSFNGDGSEFRACTNGVGAGFLCDSNAETVLDQNGQPISS